jgi:hypothetical protein
MNKQKIKFKYLMGLWKSLPHYPTKEDVKYEISIFLVKEGRSSSEFSSQTLNSVYGSKWEALPQGQVIKSMIESGEILETKKSTPSKKWYTFQ